MADKEVVAKESAYQVEQFYITLSKIISNKKKPTGNLFS